MGDWDDGPVGELLLRRLGKAFNDLKDKKVLLEQLKYQKLSVTRQLEKCEASIQAGGQSIERLRTEYKEASGEEAPEILTVQNSDIAIKE